MSITGAGMDQTFFSPDGISWMQPVLLFPFSLQIFSWAGYRNDFDLFIKLKSLPRTGMLQINWLLLYFRFSLELAVGCYWLLSLCTYSSTLNEILVLLFCRPVWMGWSQRYTIHWIQQCSNATFKLNKRLHTIHIPALNISKLQRSKNLDGN